MTYDAAFWSATYVRALRTFAQTLLAVLGAGAVDVLSVDWVAALSISAGAALLCILTCVAVPKAIA